MIARLRKLINPPYSSIDIFTLLGLLLILITIPAISLNLISVREPVSKAAQTPPCKSYGDTDLDGDVDQVDALHILNHDVGRKTAYTPFNPQQLKNADVDGDGEVSSRDSVKILRYEAGTDITLPICTDNDQDGFNNPLEEYLGTDPFDACPDSTSDDSWPPDFNKNGSANVLDITSFIAPIRRLNTKEGDANFNRRWDLNRDGKIMHDNNDRSHSDIEVMRPYLNTRCNNVIGDPTLTFKGNGAVSISVGTGQKITFAWSADRVIEPCFASGGTGGWGGLIKTSGQKEIIPRDSGQYYFKLLCGGQNGKIERTVVVNVTAPQCGGTLAVAFSKLNDVRVGEKVVVKGVGLQNCEGKALILERFWFDPTNKWVPTNYKCTVSNGSCDIEFTFGEPGQAPLRLRVENTNIASDWVNVFFIAQPPPSSDNPPGGIDISFSLPIDCTLYLSGYNYVDWHLAVDLGCREGGEYGRPIKSIVPGTVISAGWEGGCGYQVRVRTIYNGNTYIVRYCHMNSTPEVGYNQIVNAGTILGYVGQSGVANGPHLHLCAQKNPSSPTCLSASGWDGHINPYEILDGIP